MLCASRGRGAGVRASGPEPIVVNAPEQGGTPVDPTVPPPPPVDANETWGAAEDGELDEIAAIVKMSPEQRDQTRTFIRAGQSRFLQALQAAGEAGEKDITFPTGKGGEFYIENIRAGQYEARFDYKGKACLFSISVPESDETFIDIGDVVCEDLQ